MKQPSFCAAHRVTARDMQTGDTPLIDAVWHGRADEVAALLAGGADANEPKTDGGYTPLIVACGEGHTEIATALIAAGAKVNQAEDNGTTPLIVACQEGHTEIATALIAAGVKVNTAARSRATRRSPLPAKAATPRPPRH